MTYIWEVAADGIVSPEGPAADPNGDVFLVSRWTGKVLRVGANGQTTTLVETGGKPQAVAILPDGDLLLADAKNRALQKILSQKQGLGVAQRARAASV